MNRWHKDRGTWAPKHLDVSAGPATVATCQLPPAPAIVRVWHPAINAPAYKCYRVLRSMMVNGQIAHEDIGAFTHEAPARIFLGREEGKARVLDPNGKVIADNWRPLQEKSVHSNQETA